MYRKLYIHHRKYMHTLYIPHMKLLIIRGREMAIDLKSEVQTLSSDSEPGHLLK